MKRENVRPVLYTALSVLIPAILILAALAGLKVAPFGEHTLILSDGNGLYVNFLAYAARAVSGQEGLLFSFEKGLGGNMMGSWGWFLLNPFFSLFALFDISDYPSAFTYVSLLNFCLCGLTMYLLLKELYGHRRSNLIFSTSYALCGFLTANVFQMNFFTGIATLPLVVLGLRRMMENKNPLVYIFSLAYSLITNFYFGFMLCAASLLIFLACFTAEYPRLENKKAVIVKYILSSLLAGALSAVVWLPALLSLRGGRLDQSIAYAISFKENMPFLEMAAKLFTGANSTTELVSGLPNIFVGILPVALVILFFLNNKADRRRKTAAAFLLVFYLITFYIPTFNILMHGGTVTNWFNYRDSFVFSFLLLMLAAEEWQYIAEEPVESLKKASLILLCCTVLVFSRSYEFVTGGAVLLDLALLSVMALALRMHRRDPGKNPRSTLELVVLVLVSVNLFMNYRVCTKNILDWETTTNEYQETVVPVSALVDAVKKSDPDFYRMEIGKQRSGTLGNDPMLYGYNGVGHGGSDDRDFVRTALSQLGVHRFDMRNYYGKGIPAATDTLLGLKYIVSQEDLAEEKNFERLLDIGGWILYKNPDVLPVAFVANAEVEIVETDLANVFENLNQTWAAISGEDAPLFYEESEIIFTPCNITDRLTLSREEAAAIVASRDSNFSGSTSDSQSASAEEEDAPFFKEQPDNINSIKYTWVAQRDGAVYCYNASGMAENRGNILPSLLYQGYYHKGDTITGYLPISGSLVTQYLLEEVAGRFRAAYADNEALHGLATTVKSRPCTIEKVKESHLRGEFTAEAGQKLMFTIPYDEGWTCWIDGEEMPIDMVLGVFMAVDVPEGSHSYEMKFFPTGLKAGMFAAGLSIPLLIVFVILDGKKRKQKDSGSRNPDHPSFVGKSFEKIEEDHTEETTSDISPTDGTIISSKLLSPNQQPRSVIIFLLLTAISFLICMKSSYNPFASYRQSTDPAVFEYVGTVMSKGGIMYRDVFDHKGPLIYFLNWLGVVCEGKLWYIEFAFIVASMIGCYRCFRLFFENKILSAFGASLVLLQLYSYFEFGNTVEEYALPFIIWGLYIFIRFFLGLSVSRMIWLCGFFLGCVLQLRPNMIAMWVVFAIAVIVKERKHPLKVLGFAAMFVLGILLSFIPAVSYLIANHALGDCFEQYILFNFQYSGAGISEKMNAITQFFLYRGSKIVFAISILLLAVKSKKSACAQSI